MARRKINNKVVLIGLAVFAVFAVVAVLVLLKLTQGPEAFIQDGEIAVAAAESASDPNTRQEKYEEALRYYGSAFGKAKTDELQVDLLYTMADIHKQVQDYEKVVGCLARVMKLDPEDLHAHFGVLKYSYIFADSMGMNRNPGAWKNIKTESEALMDKLTEDFGDRSVSELEVFGLPPITHARRADTFVHLCHARSLLAISIIGATDTPEEDLEKAIEGLKSVIEIEPDNIQAYRLLARASLQRGEIQATRGALRAQEDAREEARNWLTQCKDVADENVQSHLSYLEYMPMLVAEPNLAYMEGLEEEYVKVANRFPDNPETYKSLMSYYMLPVFGHRTIDKAIDAGHKAYSLDNSAVEVMIQLSNAYYEKYSILGDLDAWERGVEWAQRALEAPEVNLESGPLSAANKFRRVHLNVSLSNYYTDRIFREEATISDSQREDFIAEAEGHVWELEQLLGSGEEPDVIKWRGILDLAKGEKDRGISQLYSLYTELSSAKGSSRASGSVDARLSYALAREFRGTTEVGAYAQFLTSALNNRIFTYKPETIIEYARLRLRLRDVKGALNSLDLYDREYGAKDETVQLRARALILGGEFEKAQELIDTLNPADVNTIELKTSFGIARISRLNSASAASEQASAVSQEQEGEAEEMPAVPQIQMDEVTKKQLQQQVDQLESACIELLDRDPDKLTGRAVVALVSQLNALEEEDRAKAFLDQAEIALGDNIAIKVYSELMQEPDLKNISRERQDEIRLSVIQSDEDALNRSFNLGAFYRSRNMPEKAIESYMALFDIAAEQPELLDDSKVGGQLRTGISHLMALTLDTQQYDIVDKIISLAVEHNLDLVGGRLFKAQKLMSEGEYESALQLLDEAIAIRPILSAAYAMRSRVYSVLGDEPQALSNIQKAASFNLTDGRIAKELAYALYRRNRQLGDNITPNQYIEAKEAITRAIALNPQEWRLQSFYAEYVMEENPEQALSIRQSLHSRVGSSETGIHLSQMALDLLDNTYNEQRKEFLLELAYSTLQDVLEQEPENQQALSMLGEYYRKAGKEDEAVAVLAQSGDRGLLWRHYVKAGRWEEAKGILLELHEEQPEDKVILKGLMLVAEKTSNSEDLKTYTSQYLAIEEDPDTRLFAAQTYLKMGLYEAAKKELNLFENRYPDDSRSVMLQASLLMSQGNLSEGLELTDKILEKDPSSALAWRLRGSAYMSLERYDEAVLALQRSKTLSEDPAIRVMLARAFMRSGRNEEAIAELKTLVDSPESRREGFVMLEDIYMRLGRREALESLYADALEEYPRSLHWLNKAARFAGLTNNISRAEELYKKGVEIGLESKHPAAAISLEGYLRAISVSGDYTRVLQIANQYLDTDFDYVVLVEIAGVKKILGDDLEALNYARRAMDKVGDDEELVNVLFQAMYGKIGPEATEKIVRERLQQYPDSFSANFAMYGLYRTKGEFNKALEHLDICRELASDNQEQWAQLTIRKTELLNVLYQKTSDKAYFDQSITEHETMLDIFPENHTILNNLAYMLAEAEIRLSEALEYARKAHEVAPDQGDITDTYAYVLYQNGKYAEANKYVNSSIQQLEQNQMYAPWQVYEHSGMIKEKLEKYIEAKAAYRRAIEAGEKQMNSQSLNNLQAAIERVERMEVE